VTTGSLEPFVQGRGSLFQVTLEVFKSRRL
jgi:hypothetical protein